VSQDTAWALLLIASPLVAVAVPLVLVRRPWPFVPAYGLSVPLALLLVSPLVSNAPLSDGNDLSGQIIVHIAAVFALGGALGGLVAASAARAFLHRRRAL
jgi:hypothetical protein